MASQIRSLFFLVFIPNPVAGPIVRVAPDEVDVTDIPSKNEIHTVKAKYIKSPKFYQAMGKDLTPQNVFTTVDIDFQYVSLKINLALFGCVCLC